MATRSFHQPADGGLVHAEVGGDLGLGLTFGNPFNGGFLGIGIQRDTGVGLGGGFGIMRIVTFHITRPLRISQVSTVERDTPSLFAIAAW